mmetsp:Transcript_118259/g.252545  ORF Transcript_118259/g.252545 Transcript_118259/m.252545 type:complete len:130 (-) Transcript_118259:116-505(-)
MKPLHLPLLLGLAAAAMATPRPLRGPASGPAAAASRRADAEIQLSMSTHLRAGIAAAVGRMEAGGTAGFKLHRRRERAHIWSQPCRRLPMAKRAACERHVDAEDLLDSSWVPRRGVGKPSAFTVALDHD